MTDRDIADRRTFAELLRRRFRRPLDVWSNHPATDLSLAAILVGIHLYLVYGLDMGNVLHWAKSEQRLALYAAGAGIMALIAGFTGTAIAQYGSSSGPIVNALRSTHGRAIRRNWLNIVKWMFCCGLLCMAAMAIDSQNSPKGSQWIFEAAVAISIVKVIRLLFLFDLIMSSVDGEHEEGIGVRSVLTPARRRSSGS